DRRRCTLTAAAISFSGASRDSISRTQTMPWADEEAFSAERQTALTAAPSTSGTTLASNVTASSAFLNSPFFAFVAYAASNPATVRHSAPSASAASRSLASVTRRIRSAPTLVVFRAVRSSDGGRPASGWGSGRGGGDDGSTAGWAADSAAEAFTVWSYCARSDASMSTRYASVNSAARSAAIRWNSTPRCWTLSG